jgi:uncharacterized damage-inducible protein DinB
MNPDAFRHVYGYHFAENRVVWEHASSLSEEQFARDAAYSVGSVRDQIVHLISADDVWFSQLRGVEPTTPAAGLGDRAAIRAQWDEVERQARDYLAALRDEMLFGKPFPDHPEDKDLVLWQVLLHVANHGTDHRAQVLRALNDLGVQTRSQDYVFHAYGHPLP